MDNFGRIYRNRRNEGIHIVAGRGSGKSYFLGRFLAMDDYIHEVPTVIFDNGDTIDNFFDMHRRFYQGVGKSDAQSHDRIVYVQVGGSEIDGEISPICPFPLYHRFKKESAFEVSQRFVETVRRIDPELSTASIQGYNPLWQIATMAGKILIPLDFQITEMRDLILHPDLWERRFQKALELDLSCKDAVEFFTLQYPKWPEQWKASLTRKLTLFTAEDNYKALFGASIPGINWQEVIDKKQIVLLDFRNVHNEELHRFLMLWIFSSLRDFILLRGTGGSPISIIVDELSAMMNLSDSEGSSLIAKDLDRLLNTIMRRYNLWITFAHQAMNQFPDSIQALLLGMGTQVFGRIDNMDDALHLAKSFFPIDPLKVKRVRSVQKREEGDPYLLKDRFGYVMGTRKNVHYNEDEEPVEFTIPEQHYENANKLTSLAQFSFLVRPAGENEPSDYYIKTEGEFVDRDMVGMRKLAAIFNWMKNKPTMQVQPILTEIDGRLEPPKAEKEKQPSRKTPEPKVEQKVRIVGKKLND